MINKIKNGFKTFWYYFCCIAEDISMAESNQYSRERQLERDVEELKKDIKQLKNKK